MLEDTEQAGKQSHIFLFINADKLNAEIYSIFRTLAIHRCLNLANGQFINIPQQIIIILCHVGYVPLKDETESNNFFKPDPMSILQFKIDQNFNEDEKIKKIVVSLIDSMQENGLKDLFDLIENHGVIIYESFGKSLKNSYNKIRKNIGSSSFF